MNQLLETTETDLQVDWKHVGETIKSHGVTIRAILLTGSFGRGEGIWLTDKNGKSFPINDYDIIVVTAKESGKIEYEENEQLQIELAQLLNIRQVDISYMCETRISALRKTQANFDIINGSTVVYGDGQVLSLANKFNASEIQMREALKPIWLYLTSLMHAENYVSSDNIFERYWCLQQIYKSTMGCVTAMLLINREYEINSEKRILKIMNNKLISVEYSKLINNCLKFKRNRSIEFVHAVDVRAELEAASRFHLEVLSEVMSIYYRTANKSLYMIMHRFGFRNVIKYILYLMNKKSYYTNLCIDFVKYYYVNSKVNEGDDPKSEEQIIKWLIKIGVEEGEIRKICKEKDKLRLFIIKHDINGRRFHEQGYDCFKHFKLA